MISSRPEAGGRRPEENPSPQASPKPQASSRPEKIPSGLRPPASGLTKYWLLKSEPGAYSIDDLKRDGRTFWDGVRNYQARNFMRDQMRVGDRVLFYHSNAAPPGVVGIARVIKEGYPDHTAQDPQDSHYDPKASAEDPRWYMVDIEFVEKFAQVIPLETLGNTPGLEEMVVNQRSRLSVQPVTPDEFKVVCKLGRSHD